MKVYRLESNGWGIFCIQSSFQPNYPEDALYSQFGFQCGSRYHHHPDYRSACESIDKLIEYLGSDFAYALNDGAELVEYNVHKAHVLFPIRSEVDKLELVFKYDKAKEKRVLIKGRQIPERPKEDAYVRPRYDIWNMSMNQISLTIKPKLTA